MAAFSSKLFNAANYQSYRPSYPPVLYDAILTYHARSGLPQGTAIDLGCGTGQVTRHLAERFDRVIGSDPSEVMLEAAEKAGGKTRTGREIEWKVAKSEELDWVEPGSVDLITAATCCWYFAYPETWHAIHRVLKPGGTVAFFTYNTMELAPPLSALTKILDDTTRTITGGTPVAGKDYILTLQAPAELFDGGERHAYVGKHYPEMQIANREEVIMHGQMKFDDLDTRFRTGGVTLKYFEEHPEDALNSEGDIITRTVTQLRAEAAELGYTREEVDVENPVMLLLLRKKD